MTRKFSPRFNQTAPRTSRTQLSLEALESRQLLRAGSWVPTVIPYPQVLLNEINVNPPSSMDQPYEYIELRGTAGLDLRNYYVVMVEGERDAASTPGVADLVQDLTGFMLGTNGLLVVKSFAGGHKIPPQTTVVGNSDLDLGGNGIENGSGGCLLLWSQTPIVQGQDYDLDNDGVLELPAGARLVDGIGWVEPSSPEDYTYVGFRLTQSSGTLDAASRFRGNDSRLSATAWYNGDLIGPDRASVVYDPQQASANLPPGAQLTPGAANSHDDGNDSAPSGGGGSDYVALVVREERTIHAWVNTAPKASQPRDQVFTNWMAAIALPS